MLGAWVVSAVASTAYVAYDVFARTPAMRVMRWGWVLVVAYTGPVGLAVYLATCRNPSSSPHGDFVAPLWRQATGSTIHCLAGDATGIIAAAALTAVLGFPMGTDLVVEYIAGFAFGLFIFQALFMRNMLGGSYWNAVGRTVLPEWVSMNAVMAGMAPVMVILGTGDMEAMQPTDVGFWGIMSAATLAGALLAYPVNVWLVARGLKHGMGTEQVLGRAGTSSEVTRRAETMSGLSGSASAIRAPAPHDTGPVVSRLEMVAVAAITLALLIAGVLIAASFGDLSAHG